jgi:hypothetical protein
MFCPLILEVDANKKLTSKKMYWCFIAVQVRSGKREDSETAGERSDWEVGTSPRSTSLSRHASSLGYSKLKNFNEKYKIIGKI